MTPRYYLGVDAGATKTHYLLYDRKEGALHLHDGGCANHEGLAGGFDELESVLTREIGLLTARSGISPADIASAGLGVAGVDTLRQHGIISAMLRRIGLTRFELANDASLGIHADCPEGYGVCAINGSGFSVFAVDPSFRCAQVGGLGSLTGDKGGGGYLVEEAMSAVYAQLFLGGGRTAMTEATFSLLGIDDRGDFIERLTEELHGGESRRIRRELSRMLHLCARDGDGTARGILTESGKAYAAAIRGAISALPELAAQQRIHIVLAGSGFTKCECQLAEQTIAASLDQSFGPGRCCIRRISSYPVLGALLWALRSSGAAVSDDEIDRCRRQLSAAMR